MAVPWLKIGRLEGHSYCSSLLPSEPRVLDLGGNHGSFSRLMVERYGARCIVVEPNSSLALGIEQMGVAESVHRLAIGDVEGSAELYISKRDDGSSLTYRPDAVDLVDVEQVRTLPLPMLLDEIDVGPVDLMKVDIEGNEVSALLSLDRQHLSKLSQVTIEFHDAQGYVSAQDVKRVYGHMAAGGFRRYRASVRDRSDVFFVNERLVPRLRWATTWAWNFPMGAVSRYFHRLSARW